MTVPVEYPIDARDAAWMVATGFARPCPDGAIELTDEGVRYTMDYLKRRAAK